MPPAVNGASPWAAHSYWSWASVSQLTTSPVWVTNRRSSPPGPALSANHWLRFLNRASGDQTSIWVSGMTAMVNDGSLGSRSALTGPLSHGV